MTSQRPSGDQSKARSSPGVGQDEIAPLLPETTDPETLPRLYRLLSARDPITPATR